MTSQRIADWDDAYANAAHIAGGERWPEVWAGPARAYRDALAGQGRLRLDLPYGDRPRNRFDLFLPRQEAKGLLVFVHGGYWLMLDKSYWSHLARGGIERGLAVAIPSYTLCPEVRIATIACEVAAAIEAAASAVGGPIYLAGHSAGGQLVTRLTCTSSPLDRAVQARVGRTLSISGVHDLRPLMRTRMNADLRLDEAEAMAESPALQPPVEAANLICWVGENERPEFVRQAALLANIWTGTGADTRLVIEPGRHHFDVIDGLADADHAMVEALLGG